MSKISCKRTLIKAQETHRGHRLAALRLYPLTVHTAQIGHPIPKISVSILLGMPAVSASRESGQWHFERIVFPAALCRREDVEPGDIVRKKHIGAHLMPGQLY